MNTKRILSMMRVIGGGAPNVGSAAGAFDGKLIKNRNLPDKCNDFVRVPCYNAGRSPKIDAAGEDAAADNRRKYKWANLRKR